MRRLVLAVLSSAVIACTGSPPTPGATDLSSPAASASAPAVTLGPSPTAAAVATLTPAATPTVFASPLYHYSVTLPAGWAAAGAVFPWDGKTAPGQEEPEVDKFGGPPSASMWAFAAPVSVDLKGFVKDRIAATARDHGDDCPAPPEVNEPIRIGGRAGTFIAWKCGILINQAVIVRDGVGYSFVMRDFGVAAATDRADRALFEQLLDSVAFPR